MTPRVVTEQCRAVEPVGRDRLGADCDCRRDGCPTCGPKLLQAFGENHVASGPDADGWFQSSLQISPTTRARGWALARSLAKHLEFEDSVAQYEVLLKYLPYDVNLIRETARTIESWQGIEAAAPLYGLAACLPAADPIGTPAAKVPAGLGGRLVGGLGNEAASTPVPGSCRPRNIGPSISARGDEAPPLYQALVAMEPTNVAAYFNLGQTYSGLNYTHDAIDAYQQLLEVDPCHQDAAVALHGMRLETKSESNQQF